MRDVSLVTTQVRLIKKSMRNLGWKARIDFGFNTTELV